MDDIKARQAEAQRAAFERIDPIPGEKRPILDPLLFALPGRVDEVCDDYDRRAGLPSGTTGRKALKDVPEEVYALLVKEGRENRGTPPSFVGDGESLGAARYRRQFEDGERRGKR